MTQKRYAGNVQLVINGSVKHQTLGPVHQYYQLSTDQPVKHTRTDCACVCHWLCVIRKESYSCSNRFLRRWKGMRYVKALPAERSAAAGCDLLPK